MSANPLKLIASADPVARAAALDELHAFAADHALYAATVTADKARWLPFSSNDGRGEIALDGLRYVTRLDACGVPVLHEGIRIAMRKLLVLE